MVIYSALRIALLGVLLVILYWVGLRDWLLILVAVVLALLISYLTLRGPREAAALYLAERAARRKRTGERFSREIEDDAAAEDAAVDEAAIDDAAGPDTAR